VDDGSTDATEELVVTFVKQGLLDIRYLKKANEGKHRAINQGVQMAKGELFFIVDSDDFLKSNAIERIKQEWELSISIRTENNKLGGVCFRRQNYSSNVIVGTVSSLVKIETNSIRLLYEQKIKGDKAEVFRTSILREFPFPVFKNEKFVPEALVWFRIARKYNLLFVNEAIYFCDYLPDGLSENFADTLKMNPLGFLEYYREAYSIREISLAQKLRFLVRMMQCKYNLVTKK
jgi:glycosyltransferase involved in cell wall biosynthesis